MEEKKEKRVLQIELDDDVQVVMSQELDEDELDQAVGGKALSRCKHY